MNQSAIHISSVKRVPMGTNKSHDFLVKFSPSIELNPIINIISLSTDCQ